MKIRPAIQRIMAEESGQQKELIDLSTKIDEGLDKVTSRGETHAISGLINNTISIISLLGNMEAIGHACRSLKRARFAG